MRWTQCTDSIDLLGQREGHGAATLTLIHLGKDPDPRHDTSYVVVIGGYCEGELSGEPIITPVAMLPALQWTVLDYRAAFECDGASLTNVSSSEALLFGGLDADLNRSARLYRVQLEAVRDGGTTAVPRLMAEEVEAMTGEAPSARSRHGAGFSDGRLYIFAGETDTAEQTNDLHELTVATGVWRRIKCDPAHTPSPRLLSLSLVFVTPNVMLMYGGCRFFNGELESLCDVWAFYRDRGTWGEVKPVHVHATPQTGPDTTDLHVWPRCNGHRGCRVSTSAVFLGGKDRDAGDDRVKIIHFAPGNDVFTFELAEPGEAVRAAAGVRSAPSGGDTPSKSGGPQGVAAGGPTAQMSSPHHHPQQQQDAERSEGEEEEEIEVNSRLRHPHWRYTPTVVEVPRGLLLLGGQCRHPQRPSVYLLTLWC